MRLPSHPQGRFSSAVGPLFIAFLVLAGCGGSSAAPPAPPAVTVATIAITPAAPTVAVGSSLQLTATATMSDATTQNVTTTASWTSSSTAVATVSSLGIVTATGGATAGQSTVIVAVHSGKTATATLTLTGGGGVTVASIAITPAAPTVALASTVQLTATATMSDTTTQNVTSLATWTSASTAVATVSSTGLVTAAGGATAGQTSLITAVYSSKTATATVTLTGGGGGGALTMTPASGSIPLGRSLQVVAKSGATDVTRLATWTSSNPAALTVSSTGMVAPAASATAGSSATITASQGGGQGTATLTVAAARPAIGPTMGVDPLSAQQWHLNNTGQLSFADTGGVAGQDIHPGQAYVAGINGQGVKVAVVDSGMEIAHEDLAANVVAGSWNFATGTANPTSTAVDGDHGTSVTGLIGSVYGNAKGGMGVAPGVSLNGYNFLASGGTAGTTGAQVASLGASTANPKSDDVWIFNQSYGSASADPIGGNATVEAALLSGVTTLRGGRGAIYVKSAGNGFHSFGGAATSCAAANGQAIVCGCKTADNVGVSCQNASMDPSNTLPYNIVLGALNASGVRSYYSTAGSALWVSAPGGEYGMNVGLFPGLWPEAYAAAMVTTDQSGSAAGYARTAATTSTFNQCGSPNTSCNYTNTMNGTSSAAPVTSGAIALILEANPTLTWRDVKHILASTSTRVDASVPALSITTGAGAYVAEPAWTVNAAGFAFHNWYGFGRVDVQAAVTMAQSYPYGSLGTFGDTGFISNTSLSLAVPDNSAAGVSATLTVPARTVESVQIQVRLNLGYWGDMGIALVSPSGTRSVLLPAGNGLTTNAQPNVVMQLASNAFYGEPAAGTWTLQVVDAFAADVASLTGWGITVYGH